MHVFKPEPPLAIVDPGIDPYVGSTIWLQAHRQSELKFRPAQDATGLQRFGSCRPPGCCRCSAPLLVIVLGFDAFAGEREQGTLRQMLSLGVSPRHCCGARRSRSASRSRSVLVPATGVGVVAVVSAGARRGRRCRHVARLAWLRSGYGLYLAIAVFVVLAVSALRPSSRLAWSRLLALWIATALLAPRVAADLSRKWQPNAVAARNSSANYGDLEMRTSPSTPGRSNSA